MKKIDARWIDTPSLFIDITAVRRGGDERQNRHLGALMCRNKHHCEVYHLMLSIYSRWWVIQGGNPFPLRDSLFGGLPLKIPYAYIYLSPGRAQSSITRNYLN